MSETLMTPYGVLSYPNLHTPRPPAEGAEPRYSCVLVFDAAAQQTAEFKALKAAAAAAAKARWGNSIPKGLRSPFRDCSEKEGEPFDSIAGGVFISPWTKRKPGIVGPRLEEILTPEEVWAGQTARATVGVFAYDNAGNKGVSFSLNNLQIVRRDADRVDGRRAANKDFGAIGGEAEEETEDEFVL